MKKWHVFCCKFEEALDIIPHLQHNVTLHCSCPVMKQSGTDTTQTDLTEPELTSVKSLKVVSYAEVIQNAFYIGLFFST